ncbi:MAG TPA: ParB-like protein [Anaeromyxobacteraceae bacterium]|nr:ParB-like protein [Anaeromyxobacteraceae bacterium]
MPRLQDSPLHELHPTQLTVGMIEVKKKKHHLDKLGAGERKKFMEEHPMPAVVGPEGRLFITDHHHLGRGALEAGVEVGVFQVEADLSHLAGDAFWKEMDAHAWVHPMDENGVRHRYDKIPHHLGGLVDDVYRSLAGYVRAGGGYEKTPSAFAEFVWADFFRRLIPIEDVQADFEGAVKLGMSYARSDRAKKMPGYVGGT